MATIESIRECGERHVGLRWRRKARPGTLRSGTSGDLEHLKQFTSTRGGVEAFLEPRTTVTDTTVVLVADSGEWTRRRVESPEAAAAFARKQSIPLYDAAKVGYPKRMREWTARRRDSGDSGDAGLAESAS